jgi:Rhodopirellula transposase DDE domain
MARGTVKWFNQKKIWVHPAAMVELIGATTTKTGLKVESALDTRSYQKGIKVSKAAMKCLDVTGDQFHPEWNYTIRPRLTAKS